jgi:hypothetical protein
MTHRIDCPSGLTFGVRTMAVTELMAAAEAYQANDADAGLTRIINQCWEELEDPGPYKLQTGARPDWNKILDGDVVVATMKMREAALGPMVPMNFTCEGCGRRQDVPIDVDLRTFTIKPVPENTLKAVREGKPLIATMLDGSKVHYHPNFIGQLARLAVAKKQRQKKLPPAKLKGSLRAQPYDFLIKQPTYVEALGGKADDMLARFEWAETMPLPEYYNLQEQMAAAEGGVDLSVDATCQHPNCEHEQENLTLPLHGAFWRKAKPKATEKEPTDPEKTPPPAAATALEMPVEEPSSKVA